MLRRFGRAAIGAMIAVGVAVPCAEAAAGSAEFDAAFEVSGATATGGADDNLEGFNRADVNVGVDRHGSLVLGRA